VRRTTLLVGVAVLAVAAGCTSSKKSADTQSPTTAPAVSASSLTDPAASPTGSAVPTSTAPASTVVPPTSAAPTALAPTSAPARALSGCTTAGLRMSVLRGSGASGQVSSIIMFTNRTTVPCTLIGYPGVSLLLRGAQLGSPAVRSGAAHRSVIMASGVTVRAVLIDTTTCNASQSDAVRVYPPNQTAPIEAPIVLRACRLTVGPVAP
jgi:Protein of unknown function (DUF4232)